MSRLRPTFSTLLRLLVTVVLVLGYCLLAKGQCTGYQRVYANGQTNNQTAVLSSISSASSAADGLPQTNSTIGLLLTGNIYQQLSFSSTVPTNTPITIKIGSGVGLLGVGVSVQAQAYDVAGTAIGSPTSLNSLLALLNGDNQQEIQISSATTPIKSVRITLSSTVSVGLSLKIYDAYYNTTATTVNCETIIDELHGVENPLNLVGFAGGVTTPANSIDGNLNTSAQFSSTIGVAATTQQTVIFPSQSVIGDTIKILIQTPGNLLTAQVLSSLSYSTYDGLGTLQETFFNNPSLININLLGSSSDKAWVTFRPTKVFDRLKISLGGTVSLLSTIQVYEVKKSIPNPISTIDGSILSSKSICLGQNTTLSVSNIQTCTDYKWYDAASGGTLLNTGASFIRNALAVGTYTYYVQAVRQGCSSTSSLRVPVTVTVNPLPTAPAGTATTICSGNNGVFQVTSPNALYTYNWYTTSTGGSPALTGTTVTTASAITANTTYYLEATITATGCTSATRTAVTIAVNTIAAGTIAVNQIICSGTIPIAFTNTAATAAGTLTYQWQKSTDNITFTNISGATSAAYSETAALTQTTYYQRIATSTLNTVACTTTSNKITVTVNTILAGTISASQTICSGVVPAAFTNTAATAAGTLTYQWQKSTDNVTFTNISGATSAAYSETAALTQTTYYQRIATSTLNTVACTATSNKITITVNPLPTAAISGTVTVCQSATTPPAITFTGSNGNAPYTFIYKINGGTNQSITTTTGNSTSINVSNATPGIYTYTLVSVSNTQCTQTQTGIATITVTAKPASPSLSIHVNN